jgi:primosomal protein N' (replication factor Y)
VRPLYVEVALNLPVKTCFHYRVPESLAETLVVGGRVRVPLGRRTLAGFVVGFPERPDAGSPKDVLEAVDPEPLVGPEILRLTRWMAEYYRCSWGEALHAAVPAGLRRGKGRSKREPMVARLSMERDEEEGELSRIGRRSPRARRLVAVLREMGGEAELARLLKRSGAGRSTAKMLARRGVLRIERSTGAPGLPVQLEIPVRHRLNPEQTSALRPICDAIRAGAYRTVLLHGVTGSGKTEIYLVAVEEVLRLGKGAIFLVPEIALTPQMIEIFRNRFGRVAVLHSRMSEGERARQWKAVREGRLRVVLGPRSAIFAPMRPLGVIVVDEEHEGTFKQQTTPRYHARDVAVMRARLEGAVAVLGSATPSLESYRNALEGKYTRVYLSRRATRAALPKVEVVDLAEETAEQKRFSLISRRLESRMREALGRGEQVILFLNRRGFATFLTCRRCGFVLRCPRCDISLVYHKGEGLVFCHYCFYQAPAPEACPDCLWPRMAYMGYGTERVEEAVGKAFPEAVIARLDSDSIRRGEKPEAILGAFGAGKIHILLGTQMVAKGLDFSSVTVVGVIYADTALNLPDFRSAERTFQLLSQVAGRAGRGTRPGHTVIQTFNPRHYAVEAARTHDYFRFVREEMRARQALGYPPFGRLLRILFSGRDEAKVIRAAEAAAEQLRSGLGAAPSPGPRFEKGGAILGPAPAPLALLEGRYRWHIIVKGQGVGEIGKAADILESVPRPPAGVKRVPDIDPVSML